MGDYAPWTTMIGGILHHAGVEGFLENTDAVLGDMDVEGQAWEAFLTAWHNVFGPRALTVAELHQEMDRTPSLRDLCPMLLDDKAPDFHAPGFNQRLGMRLREQTGRRHGPAELHIEPAPLLDGFKRWKVESDAP